MSEIRIHHILRKDPLAVSAPLQLYESSGFRVDSPYGCSSSGGDPAQQQRQQSQRWRATWRDGLLSREIRVFPDVLFN